MVKKEKKYIKTCKVHLTVLFLWAEVFLYIIINYHPAVSMVPQMYFNCS